MECRIPIFLSNNHTALIHLAGKVCSWLFARCRIRRCGCPTKTGMHWSVRRLLVRYSSCSTLRLSSPAHAEGRDSRLFADAFKYLRLTEHTQNIIPFESVAFLSRNHHAHSQSQKNFSTGSFLLIYATQS